MSEVVAAGIAVYQSTTREAGTREVTVHTDSPTLCYSSLDTERTSSKHGVVSIFPTDPHFSDGTVDR